MKTFIQFLIATFFSQVAFGQNYPRKPFKIVVRYAAGGAVDIVARTVGQSLQASMGQAFAALIKSERIRYAKLVKDTNIKPD